MLGIGNAALLLGAVRAPQHRDRSAGHRGHGRRRDHCGVRRSAATGSSSGSGSGSGSSKSLNVVVTGGTKGIGKALAQEFLEQGDRVVICSRNEDRVQEAVDELASAYSESNIKGITCDITESVDLEALLSFAVDSLQGPVDILINNAGTNAYLASPLVETPPSAIEKIVDTNILGALFCCRAAIAQALDYNSESRPMHVFLMDGAGADGGATPRYAAYGATKRSLEQLQKSLNAEVQAIGGNGKCVIHNLSPGMATTDLLMTGANSSSAKFFINALAEPPAEIAQTIVPQVRQVVLTNTKTPTYIRFLTKVKAYAQIFERLLLGTRKDRFVKED